MSEHLPTDEIPKTSKGPVFQEVVTPLICQETAIPPLTGSEIPQRDHFPGLVVVSRTLTF